MKDSKKHGPNPCHECWYTEWDISVCMHCTSKGLMREWLDGLPNE
jgi:RNA polymerase subunit RPABC4/transcription elongation factor Spt4